MARILFSAYACEPDKGSEPAVGWNWAVEAARLGHKVCVLTRANNRTVIERHNFGKDQNPTFLYYDLPPWVQRWKHITGTCGVIFYYLLWQWLAKNFLRRHFPRMPFDVVHHVTFASIRFPSFLGDLGVPFYFGPVGGGEIVPPDLRGSFSAKARLWEMARALANRACRINPVMRRVFQQATQIFVTPATLPLVPERFRKKCSLQLAIGCTNWTNDRDLHDRCMHHPARLLYVGRLLDSKGVDIALRALHQLRQSRPGACLTILGDGPARAGLLRLCNTLGLGEAVEWTGWLPHASVEYHYRTADILIFPAMRDSGGMVVLEALARGLPVICTDLGGPGFIVNPTCGRVIPTTGKDRTQLAISFGDALGDILSSPAGFAEQSRAARERARAFEFRNLVRLVYGSPGEPRELRSAL